MRTRILFIALTAIIISSCAGLTHVTVPQSTINIVGQDIETDRFVEYTLTKSYYFGIGGMSEKARNTNIIDELMKKANLQDNEVLAYITVSRNINNYLFITDVKFTASGYVVRPKKKGYEKPSGVTVSPDGSLIIETEQVQGVEPSKREQNQLYDTYARRINHALTADDIVKIKKEIEKDVKNGNINDNLAKKLYEKIAAWLGNK